MIMKKLLWLLLLIVPIIVNADNIKEWSDGPLSWNDFKGPASIPDVPSYMKAQLVLQPENVRVKGKNVILLERNDKIGRKLLLTGNGRCNLTNTSSLKFFWEF